MGRLMKYKEGDEVVLTREAHRACEKFIRGGCTNPDGC